MKRFGWIAFVVLTAAAVSGCRTRASYFAYTFEECTRDRDCFDYPYDLCYTVVGTDVAGMCTSECFDDWDCPAVSVCGSIDGPWLCYLWCEFDFDCPRGFGCFEVNQGARWIDVCLPI
jgi:hypothetical protein